MYNVSSIYSEILIISLVKRILIIISFFIYVGMPDSLIIDVKIIFILLLFLYN